MTDAIVSSDGRIARKQHNVDAVVDAVYELWSAGHLQPSAKEIAARSGVSLRSVFRYFDDMDTLVSVAVERRMSDTDHHFVLLPSGGSLDERCQRLAKHRVRCHSDVEAITAATRLHAPFHPPLASAIAMRADQFRDQLVALFAPELEDLDAHERLSRVGALEAAVGFDAVELLRTHRLLSPGHIEEILAFSAARLLA